MNYKDFPLISITDFNYLEIDVIEIAEPSRFVAMLNFFVEEPTDDGPLNGISLVIGITGDTLEETITKIKWMFATGMFNAINFGAHGTLWSHDDDDSSTICWMTEFDLQKTNKPTLH